MKDATLFIIGKPHKGETVVENVIDYMVDSPFADLDNVLVSHLPADDEAAMIVAMQELQKDVNKDKHRGLFHMVLSTRPSKVAQRVVDEGAEVLRDYFESIGHQAVFVAHDGSINNALNYHYHVAVNPIPIEPDNRLIDKYKTFNNMRDYLNENTSNSWSVKRTTDNKVYKKYM